MDTLNVNIRLAERRDCDSIMGLILELAAHEKLDGQQLTSKDLIRDGFDSNPPYFQCLVAEVQNKSRTSEQEGISSESHWVIIGYAMYFHKYSTCTGRGLHLEDIYVRPTLRGQGIGRRLLQQIANIAKSIGCQRIGLECLKTNISALDYYKNLNARNVTLEDGWQSLRFEMEAIDKLSINQ